MAGSTHPSLSMHAISQDATHAQTVAIAEKEGWKFGETER